MQVDLGSMEVDDDLRRALRKGAGQPGLATRDEVRTWVKETLQTSTELVLVKAFTPTPVAEVPASIH